MKTLVVVLAVLAFVFVFLALITRPPKWVLGRVGLTMAGIGLAMIGSSYGGPEMTAPILRTGILFLCLSAGIFGFYAWRQPH